MTDLATWAQLATPVVVLGCYFRLGTIRQALRDHAREDDERFRALGVRLTIEPKETHP